MLNADRQKFYMDFWSLWYMLLSDASYITSLLGNINNIWQTGTHYEAPLYTGFPSMKLLLLLLVPVCSPEPVMKQPQPVVFPEIEKSTFIIT
jgi:hypothetical protein